MAITMEYLRSFGDHAEGWRTTQKKARNGPRNASEGECVCERVIKPNVRPNTTIERKRNSF